MSKFNSTTIGKSKTVNKEGHVAYKMGEKEKLVSMVLTSFFNESKFYGDNSEELVETLISVIKEDPKFVSNLAVFARREFNMRSVSQVLTAYLANIVEGKPYVKETIRGIVGRGDDITELLSFYLSTFGKPIPNSLRKGINRVFTSFNEYTLAKYKGSKKGVKMKDVINICHPSPKNEEQSQMWKRCLEDSLQVPYTWEVEIAKRGNTKEVWEELIDSDKVGYMALLRNLRNIANAEVSNLDKVLDIISDPERIRKSKQLPFRYLSAYLALRGNPCINANVPYSKIFSALEKAVNISAENMPKYKGKTVIAIDVSGSMSRGGVGKQSDVTPIQIASVLGLLANKMCEDSIVYLFNDSIKTLAVSEYTPVLETAVTMNAGGFTYMELPIIELCERNIKADRIIYISDNESNSVSALAVQGWLNEYRKISPDCWLHAIDIEGYGTQQFCGKNTNIIAGWSEKVLDFIPMAEQGVSFLIDVIEQYVWYD